MENIAKIENSSSAIIFLSFFEYILRFKKNIIIVPINIIEYELIEKNNLFRR